MTRTIDLAVIAGDGIGPEVVAEGLKALNAVLEGSDVVVEQTAYDLGAQRWHATGDTLTDEDLESIKKHDAILLGAIGDPSVPSGVLERGLLLKLRFALDHYVNLRPNKYYPGVPTPLANPGEIDFLVVREGTEGLYCGNGGAVRVGTAQELGPALGMVDRRRPADKVLQFVLVLRAEGRIGLGGGIGGLQFIERPEQGFGNENTAVGAEMALGVGKSIRRSGHGYLSGKSEGKNKRASPRIRGDSPDGAANRFG